MSDVMSPAVVTSEYDLSFVAPAISTSIAAILGAARKGSVNKPTYITSPSQYEDTFGAPLTTDYAGHCAILYLKQANMLWFNRVGSLRGSDPVTTANTDTRATLDQTNATEFLVPTDVMKLANPTTKYLRLRFDSETAKDLTITFTAAICASLVKATLDDTMQTLCNFINTQLSGNDSFEPRYGYTTYIASTNGRRLRLYSQSKTGPYSKIEVLTPTLGSDAASDFGWTSGLTSAQGARTVMVTVDMTKAEIISAVAGPSGAFNLGTAATATSGNTEDFNLGELAEGEMNYGVPTAADGHSFVVSLSLNTAAAINSAGTLPLLLYTQLKAAPYSAINPYIRLYVDGYTVEFQVPLTTWPAAGALTNTQLQQLVNIINAACPAQLGSIAYWNSATSTVVIQSPGKNTSYSYVQIPEAQPDAPLNNAAAARLLLMALGIGSYTDMKVENGMTVEVDGDATALSFNYDTLVTQGFRPAFISQANMVASMNAQLGQTLVYDATGLDLTVNDDTPGIYGSLKMYGRGYGRALTDTSHELAASYYKPKAGTKTKAEGYDVQTSGAPTDTLSMLYVRFDFGSDWAWVGFRNLAYNVTRQTFAVGDIALLSASMPVTALQETAFKAALNAAVSAHAIKAQAGAFGGYLTSDGAWSGGVPPVAGTIANVMRAAVHVGTVVVFAAATGGAGIPGRSYVSYHLIGGLAPIEGDQLAIAGPSTLAVDRVYADRDVAIYINNSGPLALAGVNCTDISDSYVVFRQPMGTIFTDPITSRPFVTGDIAPFGGISDQVAVIGGNVTTVGATSVLTATALNQYPGGGMLLVLALDFVIAAQTYTAIVAVVPDGESYFTEGLGWMHAAAPVPKPLVDLVTICPANGLTVDFTQAGSYAYFDVTTNLLALHIIGVQTSGGHAVTAVRYGILVGAPEAKYVRCPSSTPGASAGPNMWYPSQVYSPLTNTFNTGERALSLIDDYGEGWNLFGLLVDNTYSIAVDFNDFTFLDQAASTAAEVANAINTRAKAINLVLDGIATITTSGGVQLTSPTKGSTSTLQCTLNNPAMNFSAITTVPAVGSGYPSFSVKIDGGKQYDLDFGDYVGDLIQNQAAALASEVAASLRRALAVSSSQCWDSGLGPTSQVHLTSAVDGTQGTVEVVSPNLGLAGGFGATGTTTGTESTVVPCTIMALSPGTWANPDEDNVKIRFTDEDVLFYAPYSSKVDIIVNGTIEETYHGVVPDPNADGDPTMNGTGVFIENALGNAISLAKDDNPSEFVYTEFDESVTEGSGYTSAIKFKATALGSEYELSGGANGIEALDEFDLIGVADSAYWGGATGLQVWRDKDNRFVNLMVTPGATQYSVISEMLQICESRGDCMAIIDPPFGLKPTQVIEWHNGRGYGNTTAINSSYGALYNTWILYSDPYNNEKLWLPPSCFMLAVYAYSDKVSESWFAPAGLTRGKVSGALQLQYTPTFGERELMYGTGNSVNPIVDFARDGIVVWGQKTLQRTASALDRVNVRRLLLYLRTMAELTAKVMVFEPNDPMSRRKLVNMLEGIANDVMRRRGMQRARIEDKTTSRHINQKKARIVFFLEPTQSMEIIEIPFIITASGQAFIDVEV